MDLVKQALNERFKIFDVGGDILLNSLFPNNFELYFFAFELEDEISVTDRFIFPIAPQTLAIRESKIASTIKTAGGVIDLFNTTYNPMVITLSGDFGMEFKLMIGNIADAEKSKDIKSTKSNWVNQFKHIAPFTNPFIKTGFGAFNELKRIIRKSSQLTATGKPYKLIFYNLAFSEIYLCRVLEFNPSMSVEKNMIHQFSITMNAISYYNNIGLLKNSGENILNSVKSTAKTIKRL